MMQPPRFKAVNRGKLLEIVHPLRDERGSLHACTSEPDRHCAESRALFRALLLLRHLGHVWGWRSPRVLWPIINFLQLALRHPKERSIWARSASGSPFSHGSRQQLSPAAWSFFLGDYFLLSTSHNAFAARRDHSFPQYRGSGRQFILASPFRSKIPESMELVGFVRRKQQSSATPLTPPRINRSLTV